jgi:hypothetical protein
MLQFKSPDNDAAPLLLRVGRTGIYLDSHGKTAERPPGGDLTTVRETLFNDAPLWSGRGRRVLGAHFAAHPDALFSQGVLPTNFLRHKVELLRLIGQGTHGAAFECRLPPMLQSVRSRADGRLSLVRGPERHYVIKLARSLLTVAGQELQVGVLLAGGVPGGVAGPTPNDYLRAPGGGDIMEEELVEEVREFFRDEIDSAEKMLEPACLRRFRLEAKLGRRRRCAVLKLEVLEQQLAGTRLRRLSSEQYMELMDAARTMRAHPGYHHMHQILHFDPLLPALFSEGADADLDTLQNLCRTHASDPQWLRFTMGGEPPALWTRIGKQLASAFAYMRECSPLAHIDLKPSNVLVQCAAAKGWGGGMATPQAPGHDLRCMITDYGLCYPANELTNERKGTAYYSPPESDDQWWKRGTMRSMSAFLMASTLLDLLQIHERQFPADFIGETCDENGNRTSTVVEVFRFPPDGFKCQRGGGRNATAGRRALGALLAIACPPPAAAGGRYTPESVQTHFDAFSAHIAHADAQ